MNIHQLESSDRERLFAFWRAMTETVPYYFPVTEAAWWQALIAEQHGLMGLHLRPETARVWIAEAQGQILGFAQAGQPNVDISGPGGIRENPTDVLILRHLLFRPEFPEAGRALLTQALSARVPGDRVYAFCHAHGMSCSAHHGKLHESMPWIHDLLVAAGFAVEHENLYFSLDLSAADEELPALELAETEPGAFEARYAGTAVGTARVVSLGALTGGASATTVYLRWMGVEAPLRGQGLGKRLLGALVAHFRAQGFLHMHLDTALGNTVAQSLYRRTGFVCRGVTRSYQLG